MNIAGIKQVDIAQKAGVSKAAVSKWFQSKTPCVNIETNTLRRLAESLGVSSDVLLQPGIDVAAFETTFLWDHLYPNLEDFTQALLIPQLPALARLVQVLGFHEAQVVAGRRVLRLFDRYKKYIKPARRKQLELLWQLYNSPK